MLQSIVVGIIPGSVYALIAVSIILTYRMLGVLDFSQTTVGAFGTYVGFALFAAGAPNWLAVLAGILSGIVLSMIVGSVMIRWFSSARIETKSSVTVAIMLALLAIGFRLFGNTMRAQTELLPDVTFAFGQVNFGLSTIAGLAMAVLVGGVIIVVLRYSRLGVLLRALSERPTTAELLGIPVQRLALLVWATAGGVATLAITLIAPNRTGNFLALSMLLLPGMAGALFGLFKSVPLAVLGGLVVGLLEGTSGYFDAIAPYRGALPFIVILVVLLWSQRGEVWDEAR
jgi:branched-chain amino acid transport system permease protein